MARQRISTTELARTFNAVTQPIYVLDDELTVVFCNRACLDWLGEAAEGLIGRRCAYHSSPEVTGPDAAAARLCPPPDVLAGRNTAATVSCDPGDGSVACRRATFIPLGSGPENLIGVVAILGVADLPEPDADAEVLASPPAELDSLRLHEHVRRFRRQATAGSRAGQLIGVSPAMRRVRSQVEVAAGSRASVLLIGPAGSGRQHVASAIHYGRVPQHAGALIPLACSVLDAELIRSTVAALATGGSLPEQPGPGTLLLNNADELPADVQAELAVLLTGKPFPLRLIATAGQPLEELVYKGTYCADLAVGLSTITIELPPLAERREDVPLLAQAFLEEANARGDRQLGGFTPEALDRLDAYPWPGNVDELVQVVAAAQRQAEGPKIGVDDLPRKIHLAGEAAAHPHRAEETIVLDEFLGRVERELIVRALARAKGNKAKAARLLGLTRPRLYRRLVQLGLEEDQHGSQ